MEVTEATEQDWKKRAVMAVSDIKTLKIVDASTYAHMGNLVLLCQSAIKYFGDLYRPRIKQANQLADDLRHDLVELQHEPSHWSEQGQKAMAFFRAEQQRKADEAALKVRADLLKKREEEKSNLAQAAADAGDTELAQTILEEQVQPEPVVVKPDIPQVEGITTREEWDFEVTDWKQIPARFHRMEQNAQGEWSCKAHVDVRSEVRRMKQSANIPGVRVYKREITVKKV